MTTTPPTAALSNDALELLTDRTSHALEHTENLQALCRLPQRVRSGAEELDDDPAGDLLKVVTGMSTTFGLLRAAILYEVS